MRTELEAALQGVPASIKRRSDWILAVNEACMNVIQHGYGEQPGEIQVRVLRLADRICFDILDAAPLIDQGRLVSRPLDELRPGGLGLHIMQSVMDEVKFLPNPAGEGNMVRMCAELGG
jgi:sigma-B regulation protein RsbU (phosphoserine phosphatase)